MAEVVNTCTAPFCRGEDRPRSVGGLACHRGLGQKLGLEILDREQVVVGDDSVSPLQPIMAGLSTRLLVDLRCVSLRSLVALRLGVPAWPAPAGHLPLCLPRLGRAPFPVPAVGKVVGRSAAGASWTSRRTTNDTYQSPRESW